MSAHSKPIRLASAAMQAALASKHDSAVSYLQRINDECGGQGLYVALMAWCDAYADHATGGAPTPARVNMSFIREDTGQLDDENSDRLPPEIRWAGQIVAARAALDQDRFDELITKMPDDGAGRGDYMGAVLLTIANTINGLPRGFARMGRTS